MNRADYTWERRYAQEGIIDREPFPRFPEVAQIFRENNCERILDLGCGTGNHALALSKAGFSVIGVDVSPTGLMLAHNWAKEEVLTIPFALMDMRVGLPFASLEFDAVFSARVIHHAKLKQIRRTIDDIHRVLQPGGWDGLATN